MVLLMLWIIAIGVICAHPTQSASLEEMKNLDVHVITAKLQDCLLLFLQIKTHVDYSKVSTPFVLKDFVNRSKWELHRWRIVRFKVQNIQCHVMIVLTGDELDTVPPRGFRTKRETDSFPEMEMYNSAFVKIEVLNTRVIPMLLLILHCNLVTNYLFDKISRTVRSEYLNARTFVLSQGKAENNFQTYSGYYICWFYINCRIPFHCYASECIDKLTETFDLATNFGKRLTWKQPLIIQD
ncbi:unnamed protein product [Allacma fusca]|uniref:Uncharacterized protein n=1 Tax=Allacma fusca TaxID=39272 RepID=A0A8J2PG54_9HEXA|nr:unnamed protein product [Allacma fusca]